MNLEPLPFPGSEPPADPTPGAGITVDCDRCSMRGPACQECVISVLLGPPPERLDPAQHEALDVLARSGMVPPLRLVTSVDPEPWDVAEAAHDGA